SWPSRLLGMALRLVAYGCLVVFAVATLMPLIWMISTEFKPNDLVLKLPPVLIPSDPTLDNFRIFFAQPQAWRWIFNSVFVVTIITLAHVVFYTLAGYA